MALYTTNNRRLNEIMHSSRGGSYAVVFVTILVVLVMLLVAILPAYQAITDQIANNKAKSIYLAALDEKKTAMDLLQQQYDSNLPLIEVFNEYNLRRSNNELMTANLDAIAKNFNVYLNTVNYDETPSAPETAPMTGLPNLLTQGFTCQLKGNLADLEALLAYLETYPVPISFNTISYAHADDADNQPTLALNPIFEMSISAYYYFWYTQPTVTTP